MVYLYIIIHIKGEIYMFKIFYAAFLANKKGDETIKPKVNGITIFFMIKTVISICVFIFLMKRMAKLMPELLWNIMTGFQYLSMTLTVIFAAKAVLKKSWRCAVASFLCFILNCVFSIAKIIAIKISACQQSEYPQNSSWCL